MIVRRTNGRAAAWICALAVLGLAAASPAAKAQERELNVERILNPMPELDPFDRAPTAPQFFPDEVDKRARELLIDTLTQRGAALPGHLEFLRKQDAELQKQHGQRTGLADHALDLVNNNIQDRERYMQAQKDALRTASTPERKKYLETLIKRDDYYQSEQLMRQSTTNFWGGVVNRLLSSVDLVGVASGNYIGAAAETAVSQLYNLLDRDMAPEQRRALARDLDHLKRYPDDPRNAEVRKQVDKLEQRKRDTLVRKQIDKAKEARDKDDLERALFHADIALFFDPKSDDAEKFKQQTAKQLQELEAVWRRALAARAEPSMGAEQRSDTHRLLQALSLRDSNLIQKVAIDTERKYQGKPLADAARDAEAVALEIKGWHEPARKAVEQIAASAVTPAARQRSKNLLLSADYNRLNAFKDARSERQLQTAKYVLFGENFLRKNFLFAAGAMAAAGPAGAATLGMANAMMLSQNIFQVMTNNPISAQPVIDAGVSYVRSHPNSENAAEVFKVLGDAYEERGMFDRAISYHELAGSPKTKLDAIREKSARALLMAATKANSRSSQENYLKAVIDFHPDTPSAREATGKLATMVKDENQGLRMSKQFLLEYPEIWGPRGLGLKASLLDGKTQNYEIADRGVNLLEGNELVVHYQTPWGVRSQSYFLQKTAMERVMIAMRDKNQQVAAADANQRARDSVGGIPNLPPALARGDGARRSQGGFEDRQARDDTTFTLIREAGGSSYRKVLDANLLSENERNPDTRYQLPPMQGSISASRFSMTGSLPTSLGGNRLAVGSDGRSPFGGVQLPIPLLEGFIPVDFMVQGRPGGVSVFPRIRTGADTGSDPQLYR